MGASALGSPSSAANEAPACSAGVMIDLGGAAIFSGSWGPVTSPTALLNLLVIIGDTAIHVNVDYVLRYLLVAKMGLERRHLQLSATAPRSNAGTIHCPASTGNMKRGFDKQIDHFWLVVSTPLKNINQMGLLFPIYGKIKAIFQSTNQICLFFFSKNCLLDLSYHWLYQFRHTNTGGSPAPCCSHHCAQPSPAAMPGASPEPARKRTGDTWNIWGVLKIGLSGHPKSSKTLDHDLYSIEFETHGLGVPPF